MFAHFALLVHFGLHCGLGAESYLALPESDWHQVCQSNWHQVQFISLFCSLGTESHSALPAASTVPPKQSRSGWIERARARKRARARASALRPTLITWVE